MGNAGDQNVVLNGDPVDAGQHLRNGGNRYAHVLGQHRAEPLQRWVGEPAGGKEGLRLLLIGRARRPGGAGGFKTGQHLVGQIIAC